MHSSNHQTSLQMSGDFSAPRGKIAIVASRFNDFMVSHLIQGAQDSLQQLGLPADQVEIIRVPGAFEIPLACQKIAQTNRFVGIIALGVVIRGATPHFDYVAAGCASGLQEVQLKNNIPITFGVLTTESIEQAIERSGAKSGNKGSDCALALIEMINLLGKINGE